MEKQKKWQKRPINVVVCYIPRLPEAIQKLCVEKLNKNVYIIFC